MILVGISKAQNFEYRKLDQVYGNVTRGGSVTLIGSVLITFAMEVSTDFFYLYLIKLHENVFSPKFGVKRIKTEPPGAFLSAFFRFYPKSL